jgi:uncharacterized linocin/CFP29 family protein
MRDKAPITDAAWAEIDAEATRSLTHFLAGRKLVDFSGPHGWEHSSVDLGRVQPLADGPVDGVVAARRRVQPLIELRTPFTVSRAELDAADRGAADLDLDAVMAAARSAAMAEDGSLFHGYAAGGIEGIAELTPHPTVEITDDYSEYPSHVAKAVAILRAADIGGPYAIALGPDRTIAEAAADDHIQVIVGGSFLDQHLARLEVAEYEVVGERARLLMRKLGGQLRGTQCVDSGLVGHDVVTVASSCARTRSAALADQALEPRRVKQFDRASLHLDQSLFLQAREQAADGL